MHLAGDSGTYQRKKPRCKLSIHSVCLFFKAPVFRTSAASNNSCYFCRVERSLHGIFYFLHTRKEEVAMTPNKNFLTAADVSEYMGISVPMAYKIIRKLNDELKAQGFITVSGKINRRYFELKVNGFMPA